MMQTSPDPHSALGTPRISVRTLRCTLHVRHIAFEMGKSLIDSGKIVVDKGKIALLLLIVAISTTACGQDEGRTVDSAATYDAYGSPVESAGAVPAHAVVAEPDVYLDRDLIVEGMTTNECDIPECWTTLDAGNDDRIQVIVARHDDGSFAFDVPSDVVGRRIIAAGTLRRGSIDETRESEAPRSEAPRSETRQSETGEPETRESPDDMLEAPAETESDSTYSLLATGVLIEKVRP